MKIGDLVSSIRYGINCAKIVGSYQRNENRVKTYFPNEILDIDNRRGLLIKPLTVGKRESRLPWNQFDKDTFLFRDSILLPIFKPPKLNDICNYIHELISNGN